MVTPEQGLLDLEQTYKREVSAGWEFIRKLAAYVAEWGPSYYYQVADHMGLSPKTLRDYASVARNPISHYAESLGLTRGHARAVLGLPDEEAKALLLKSAEDGLSEIWLRYEIRQRQPSRILDKKEERLMTTAQLDRTEQDASPFNDNSANDKTYQATVERPATPVLTGTLTALYDGATQNRPNGVDPFLGVTVAESDDIPFSHLDIELRDDDTAYDVAERIVEARGVEFAKEVAGEILRWGKWGG